MPFSPLSLSPHLWLDPSDLSTLFSDVAGTTPASIDGLVAAMANKGTLGGLFTQSTEALRPALRSTGGLYWLEYNANPAHLRLEGHSAITRPVDILEAIRTPVSNTSHDIVFNGNTPRLGSQAALVFFGQGGDSITAAASGDTDYVVTLRIGAADTHRLAVDNNAYVEDDVTVTESQFTATDYGSPFDGTFIRHYGAFIGFPQPLTDNQIAQLRTYLAAKQGRDFGTFFGDAAGSATVTATGKALKRFNALAAGVASVGIAGASKSSAASLAQGIANVGAFGAGRTKLSRELIEPGRTIVRSTRMTQ